MNLGKQVLTILLDARDLLGLVRWKTRNAAAEIGEPVQIQTGFPSLLA